MAEKIASDELIAEIEASSKNATLGPWIWVDEETAGWVESPTKTIADICSTDADGEYIAILSPDNIAAILARLRKAEADNANMAKMLAGYHQICSEAGIAPATSEIYAAADRAKGGGDE